MSLLLDALKKAAEQKAEKSKEKQAEAPSSEETVVDSDARDATDLDASNKGGASSPRRAGGDDTQLDGTEINTRIEPAPTEFDRGQTAEAGDDPTERVPDPSSQMQTGEDETIVFAEGDVSDFMEGRVSEDQTEVGRAHFEEDRTSTDYTATRLEQDNLDQAREADEQTDFGDRIFNEDETEYKERTVHDETSEWQDATDMGDPTDISVPQAPRAADAIEKGDPMAVENADITDTRTVQSDQGVDETAVEPSDEDMSLLLVDQDKTDLTGQTSLTDPQEVGSKLDAIQDASADDDLALVDTTRHQPPGEQTSTQATTQNRMSGGLTETQTTEGTTRRADATSTRTYAPDNYDRTLMKLPSDDASRLFAGMKSDADVVMTPDYAKKVFQSKSSAQRLQHYKFYAGIAVVILLSIGVFGLFEMQEESNKIDASLRPLKQDPMPGVIRQESSTDGGLTLSGVDAQTLKLIQNANDQPDAPVAEEGVVSGDPDAGQDSARAPVETAAATNTSAAVSADSILSGEVGARSDDSTGETVDTASLEASRDSASTQTTGSVLQISSGSRIEEKQIWLREAWEAYRSGNDSLAMTRYNQVLEIDPGNRNALLGRAAINIQNNNSIAAIEDYQALLLANPKDTLAMTSLLSVANYSPQDAETQLKLMLRDEPESPYLNFALANAFGAQNRWQEAQRHYFIALENNPGDPNYAYNLAVSLEHIAKPSVAIAYYQRALDNFNNGLATFNREVVDQRLETLRKL